MNQHTNFKDILYTHLQSTIQSKLQNQTNHDHLRDIYTSVTASTSLLNMNEQSFGANIVIKRVFIYDVLENDIFIGVNKLKEGNSKFTQTLWAFNIFGQEWDDQDQSEDEQNFVFCDRANVLAKELELDIGVKETNHKCHLRYYQAQDNKINTPKIYSVQIVIGFITQSDDGHHIIDVIHQFDQDPLLKPVSNIKTIYQELLSQLVSLFFGDQKAAKLVLLTILTKVNWRNFEEIGGSMILNIFGVSEQEAHQITETLKKIVCPTYIIPLSLSYLQNQRFAGEKDFDNDSLLQGVLCFPSNCHSLVILDETQMKQGALDEKGVINIKHVENLVNLRIITLDYKYSTVEIKVDSSILIFSAGKSCLPHTVNVKLSKQSYKNELMDLDENKQKEFQNFICYVQEQAESMKLSKELQEQINTQYVEMRKNPEAQADEIKLSRWISNMKVLSCVNGEDQAKYNYFLEAIEIE